MAGFITFTSWLIIQDVWRPLLFLLRWLSHFSSFLEPTINLSSLSGLMVEAQTDGNPWIFVYLGFHVRAIRRDQSLPFMEVFFAANTC